MSEYCIAAMFAPQQSIAKYLLPELVSIVNGYYVRSEPDVIAALMILPAPDLKNHRQFLTRMETAETGECAGVLNVFDGLSEYGSSKKHIATNDRWIFECSSTGTYVRFLGKSYGVPCDPWAEHCRIVVTHSDHNIVVEINGESIYESWCNCKNRQELFHDRYATLTMDGELIIRPEHGLFFNVKPTCIRPFERRALAGLRRQFAGIMHRLREDDAWHDLFTKVCDLADRTITDWYF